MKKAGLFLVVVMTTSLCFGQKVKYKDLYLLLAAKDYEKAEKYLRLFLIQDPDHPNANFNAALFYEYKMNQQDMLKQSDNWLAYADSTIRFFNKSYGLITEKEVKKNDDYYQDYFRRDLRTGKYGVKLADVQLDIETRLEVLKTQSDLVAGMSNSFNAFVSAYDSAFTRYNQIHEGYEDYTVFIFNARDADVSSFPEIKQAYDRSMSSFNSYVRFRDQMKEPPYNQVLTVKSIRWEAIAQPDYFANDLTVYNLSDWVVENETVIKETINPIIAGLVGYDTNLDQLRERTWNGENVIEEWRAEASSQNFEGLAKYDEHPLPLHLFQFKGKQIIFTSEENQRVADGVYDTLNIDLQYNLYSDAMNRLMQLKSSYEELAATDQTMANKLYGKFITQRYGGASGLSNAISNMGKSVEQDQSLIQFKLDSLHDEMLVAYSETDTFSMVLSDSLTFPLPNEPFRLTMTIDSLDSGYWISGYEIREDATQTFLANVNYNREVSEALTYDFIDKKADLIALASHRIPVDSGGVYLVHYAADTALSYCQVVMLNTSSSSIDWTSTLKPKGLLTNIEQAPEGHLILLFRSRDEEDDAPEVIGINKEGKVINPDEL